MKLTVLGLSTIQGSCVIQIHILNFSCFHRKDRSSLKLRAGIKRVNRESQRKILKNHAEYFRFADTAPSSLGLGQPRTSAAPRPPPSRARRLLLWPRLLIAAPAQQEAGGQGSEAGIWLQDWQPWVNVWRQRRESGSGLLKRGYSRGWGEAW